MIRAVVLALLCLPAWAGAREAAPLDFVERLTGGAAPTDTLPLILAIHGLGDRPEHFVRWLEALPFPARVVAARAPTPHGRGSSWFPTRLPYTGERPETVRGVADATEQLAHLTRWLVKHRPTRGRPVVLGFSQGGVLSYALAARHPELFAAAVPIAGALPPSLFPHETLTAPLPVHAFHGAADTVVSAERCQKSVEALRAAGLTVHWTPYPGVQHSIPAQMRRAIYQQLADRLGR